MTSKQDQIREKIKKLLAIAGDSEASDAEVDSVMSKANKLMAIYHISEEDLAHEPADDYAAVDSAEKGRFRAFVGTFSFAWEGYLSITIAEFVGCKTYRDNEKRCVRSDRGIAITDSKGNPQYGKSFVFYGVAEDAQLARDLYNDMRAIISSMAVARFGGSKRGPGAAYAEGFCNALWKRVKLKDEPVKIENTTTALIIARASDLVEYKKNVAENWLSNEHNVKLHNETAAGSDRRRYRSAFKEGVEDGEKADLSAERKMKLS